MHFTGETITMNNFSQNVQSVYYNNIYYECLRMNRKLHAVYTAESFIMKRA